MSSVNGLPLVLFLYLHDRLDTDSGHEEALSLPVTDDSVSSGCGLTL